MQEVLIRASRTALLLALAAIALPARSLVLGDAEVRSALGERLDARIPVTSPDGQAIEASCFSLLQEPEAGLPVITEGAMTVERSGGAAVLRVRSANPIREPAVTLRVRAACAGESNETVRQYSLLLDPRAGSVESPTLPAVTATIAARSGDTLQSIAFKVMPGSARAQYLAAMRELNPALASRGDRAPLPAGARVALPDLRDYVRAKPSRAVAAAPAVPGVRAELAAPVSAPPKAVAERAAKTPAPAATAAAPSKPRPAVATAPRAPSRSDPGFALKLSSSEVDLSRSRQIDDRMRAQLRGRLLVLDSDDQVAAMLAMRDSLKQLESRVAELQLKLAGMPESLAARADPAAAAAPKVAAPKAPAAKAPEPKAPEVAAIPAPAVPVAPPVPEAKTAPVASTPEPVATAPTPPTPPIAADPAPPKSEAPKAEPPPPAAITPEPSSPKPEASPAPAQPYSGKVIPRPATTASSDGLPSWLWGLVAILVALAALLALRVFRRPRDEEDYFENRGEDSDDFIGDIADPHEPSAEDAIFAEAPILMPEDRQEIASDADLATRLPEDSGELRRRYIEGRFPEISNRTIVLDDPNSVVKGARLFYEDGAQTRAIELLQFAIEDHPREMKTWLALFEIYRLERQTVEFAELATRFKAHHGDDDNWGKVKYFGREIDPGNALYQEESFSSLETIGPSEARRIAKANATFDPIAENWLNAPMDFQNEVLANELRQALMTEASLAEHDLIPNPMPALRNVEMFTVA